MDDGAFLLFSLILRCVFGAIAAAIASGKGRTPVGWFFGGFFIGLIGIIIIACLSNLNEEQARLKRDQEEKRRLREQLRQEQMKNESFRDYTMQRLDAHDEALQIETRNVQAQPALTGGTTGAGKYFNKDVATAPPPDSPEVPEALEEEWYYSKEGRRLGPLSLHELQQMAAAGEIAPDTLVWSESMADWAAAGEVPKLASTIRKETS